MRAMEQRFWTRTEFCNVQLGNRSGPVHPVQVPGGFLVPYLDSEHLLHPDCNWESHARTAYLALEHEPGVAKEQAVQGAEEVGSDLSLILSLTHRRPVFHRYTVVYGCEDMTGKPLHWHAASNYWSGMPFQRRSAMYFHGGPWEYVAIRFGKGGIVGEDSRKGWFATGLPEFIARALEEFQKARAAGHPLRIPVVLHLDAVLVPIHAEVRFLLECMALESLAARAARLCRVTNDPAWREACHLAAKEGSTDGVRKVLALLRWRGLPAKLEWIEDWLGEGGLRGHIAHGDPLSDNDLQRLLGQLGPMESLLEYLFMDHFGYTCGEGDWASYLYRGTWVPKG